jgi:hypothetical protein
MQINETELKFYFVTATVNASKAQKHPYLK